MAFTHDLGKNQALTPTMILTRLTSNVLEIIPREDWDGVETKAVAEENMRLALEFMGEKGYGVLAELPSREISKEARETYQGLEHGVTATAFIAKNFIQKVLGNLFVSYGNKFRMPVKLFTSREEALTWLNEMLQKDVA